FLSNLDQEYSDAYLSLITSNMEGFSLALLESLAHGVPVISYDVDYGPSELIQDGFNGYLVPQGDINQMVEKVDQLLNNTQK
ncbi:glycosyltransferase, partial [Staphylococcus aureus]|nr:glycosyltransferase [Staphylococcus aureus]